MSSFNFDLNFLEKITNAFGPSGHETEVQKLVKEYGMKFAEETLADKMGSIVFKRGTSGPKVMLAGHVDEIGYIISAIEPNGMLKISNLGGVFPGNLMGQEILIRPFKGGEKIIGIVALPFSRLLNPKTRDQVPKLKDIYVDIGCSSKKEAEQLGIRVGDPAVPYAHFRTFIRNKIKLDDANEKSDDNSDKSKDEIKTDQEEEKTTLAVAKAFDDRIGVFIILEVLRRLTELNIQTPNQIFSASTTQEEVGLRGARTAARLIEPDVAFSLDVTISNDTPGSSGNKQGIGKGPVISVYDGSMIPNPRLRKFIIETAETAKIPVQDGFLAFGGTDAGVMHTTKIGCPSMFIGIATRYVHGHHAMLDLYDVELSIQLLVELLQKLNAEVVASFTAL